ncbi:MAG: hypothetical protein AAB400_01200 [Patescibacteria group bacterium]
MSTFTTHICTLSFCKLRLEVDGDTIHIQFIELPEEHSGVALTSLLTPSDATDLVHFVFHRERLGVDFASLFFEWKDTIELRRKYFNVAIVPQTCRANSPTLEGLLGHLQIVSMRYLKIIGSHCNSTDRELLAFFELLEEAIIKLA